VRANKGKISRGFRKGTSTMCMGNPAAKWGKRREGRHKSGMVLVMRNWPAGTKRLNRVRVGTSEGWDWIAAKKGRGYNFSLQRGATKEKATEQWGAQIRDLRFSKARYGKRNEKRTGEGRITNRKEGRKALKGRKRDTKQK